MNNRGISLIEILAVIAVMGVIMYIGVQSFNVIIKSQRQGAMDKAVQMMEMAAENYVLDNPEFLPYEINQSIKVNLKKLAEIGLIDPIVDQFSDEDDTCSVTGSFTRVTKIRENKYEYQSLLVCPNYISDKAMFYDEYDLLDGIGSFENDSDGNGIDDNWYSNGGINSIVEVSLIGSYAQKNNHNNSSTNTQYPGVYTYVPVDTNNKYYYYGYLNNISNSEGTPLLLFHRLDVNDTTVSQKSAGIDNTTYDQYQFTSMDDFVTDPAIKKFRLYCIAPVSPGDSSAFMCDNIKFINLTSIYGAGNEPTKAQLDKMFKE